MLPVRRSFGALLLLCIVSAGCGKSGEKPPAAAPELPPKTLSIPGENLTIEAIMWGLFRDYRTGSEEPHAIWKSSDRTLFREMTVAGEPCASLQEPFEVTASFAAADTGRKDNLTAAFLLEGYHRACTTSRSVMIVEFDRDGSKWMLTNRRLFFPPDEDVWSSARITTIRLGKDHGGFLVTRSHGLFGNFRYQRQILAKVDGRWQSVLLVISYIPDPDNPAGAKVATCDDYAGCYDFDLRLRVGECGAAFCELTAVPDGGVIGRKPETFEFTEGEYRSKD